MSSRPIDPSNDFGAVANAWFYAGPYVPSGVIYGRPDWPSRSHWLIPGYDIDSHEIDLYARSPSPFRGDR